MDRSLYPEGVEVHQSNLAFTEDEKIFHILQRHKDNSKTGVVYGLEVTVNTGNATLFNVAAGYGYTPNGEMAELGTSRTAIALAEYTNGIDNLVCLVYSETHDNLQPHETNGNVYSTEANRSVRLKVFTQTQYDDLSYTDANLDNDAKDRILIIATITAKGTGSTFVNDDINNADLFTNAITVTNLTNNITGVDVTSVDADTTTGTATLEYVYGNGTLRYIAPGDSSGDIVNVLSGGNFTLKSCPSEKIITIYVSSILLPITDEVDSLNVDNLYYNQAQRHSAEDAQHRSLLGSGIPTLNNPHGLTLSDLGASGTPIEEHQATFHANGILRTSDSSTLFAYVNTLTTPDTLNITVPSNFKVYLLGALYTSSNQTTVTFSDIVDNTQILFDIYAKTGPNNKVDIERLESVRFDTLSTLTTHVQLRKLSKNTTAGAGLIEYNDSTKKIKYTAPGDSAGTEKIVPTAGVFMIRLFSGNNIDFIDLYISSSLRGTGNHSEAITVTAYPTADDLKGKLLICAVLFSGAATGYLGNGFGVNNSPNLPLDERLFGVLSQDNLRDDTSGWNTKTTNDIALNKTDVSSVTNRQVGIINSDYNVVGSIGYNPVISNTTLGSSQFTVVGRAYYLGQSVDQYNIFSAIQYAQAEGGIKNGIQSEVHTSYTTGGLGVLNNINSKLSLKHSGAGIFMANGILVQTEVNTGASVGYLVGVNIFEATGTAAAGIATIHYGLLVGNINKSSSENYAIYTNDGIVRFGDSIFADGASLHTFINTSDQVQVHLRGGPSNNNSSVLRFIDGSTNYVGGYIKYDSLSAKFKIGMHSAFDSDPLNDTDFIIIDKNFAIVGIKTAPLATYALTVGGNTMIVGDLVVNTAYGMYIGSVSGAGLRIQYNATGVSGVTLRHTGSATDAGIFYDDAQGEFYIYSNEYKRFSINSFGSHFYNSLGTEELVIDTQNNIIKPITTNSYNVGDITNAFNSGTFIGNSNTNLGNVGLGTRTGRNAPIFIGIVEYYDGFAGSPTITVTNIWNVGTGHSAPSGTILRIYPDKQMSSDTAFTTVPFEQAGITTTAIPVKSITNVMTYVDINFSSALPSSGSLARYKWYLLGFGSI